MAQVDSENTANTPIATQVANGLAEMEHPLLRVRDLMHCLEMMAQAQDEEETRMGLEAFAEMVAASVDTLSEERTRLWILAREIEKGRARLGLMHGKPGSPP
jgi:hypothetical protein